MNERIQELSKLAHDQALGIYRKRMETEFPGDVIFYEIYDRLFAASIVQECMSVVEDAVDHREPASTYVGKIQQHFGVK
jgi:hypothetical protein